MNCDRKREVFDFRIISQLNRKHTRRCRPVILELLADAFDEVDGVSCSTYGAAIDFGNALLAQRDLLGRIQYYHS